LFGIFFPVLVYCTKKNLATLRRDYASLKANDANCCDRLMTMAANTDAEFGKVRNPRN
jgi:alkylhydroperoxidase family enzyme